MTEHYLMFSAGINQQILGNMVSYLTDLKISGTTKLTIAMSSPGGNVVCGMTMHNAIASMPYEIITHNIGNVDSIAVVVFLAGKRRFSNITSTFMFHGVGFDGNANERLEEKNLLEKLDTIMSDHNRLSKLMSSKTSLSVEDCMELFKLQKTRDADWAKSSGFVDDIADFRLPSAANVKYLV